MGRCRSEGMPARLGDTNPTTRISGTSDAFGISPEVAAQYRVKADRASRQTDEKRQPATSERAGPPATVVIVPKAKLSFGSELRFA